MFLFREQKHEKFVTLLEVDLELKATCRSTPAEFFDLGGICGNDRLIGSFPAKTRRRDPERANHLLIPAQKKRNIREKIRSPYHTIQFCMRWRRVRYGNGTTGLVDIVKL